jgi:hypothetical protein
MKSLKINNEHSDLNMNISLFINENFNKQLLFTHSLHPTNVLLYELWRYVLEKLSINIEDNEYKFQGELIDCCHNPFTNKMVKDLNILFNPIIDNNFYISRYNKYRYII